MNVYIGQPIVVSDMQGPAPSGFHVPLSSEWQAIYNAGISLGAWNSSSFDRGTKFSTYLKMPYTGYRNYNKTIDSVGENGMYYSSSPDYNRLFIRADSIVPEDTLPKAFGASIRAFKDSPVVPDSTRTELYTNGIYHNSILGLISVKNGSSWITIADKNLGATTVYNYGDTLTDSNCGNVFQWGNNYAFPGTKSSDSIPSTATRVDASNYGPGNYYNSSKWITYNGDWSNPSNNNLRGGVTQGSSTVSQELQNAYIGEYKGWKPGANTVAYYPLEIDTKDYSGNSRDGTNNGVTFSNGIATFNNSRITIPSASWNYPSSNMTIQAWAKNTSTSSDYQFIVAKQDFYATNQQTFFYAVYIDNNSKLIGGFANGSNYSYYPGVSSFSPSLNTWHLYTLTTDGNTKTLYVDGTQVLQASSATTTSTYSMPLTIGAAIYRDHNGYFYGNISKVILENKTWSAQEISSYYNQTKSNYGL